MSTSFLDLPPPYGSIFEESENYLPPPEYANEHPHYSVLPSTAPYGFEDGFDKSYEKGFDKYSVGLQRNNTSTPQTLPPLSRNDSYSYSDSYQDNYPSGYAQPPPYNSSLSYAHESSIYGDVEESFSGHYNDNYAASDFSRERSGTPASCVIEDREYTATPPPASMRGMQDDNNSMRSSHPSSFQKHHSRPKPGAKGVYQCWDHGCCGKIFSTHSNLLRHRREKQLNSVKFNCRKCGAAFTRTTALNSHFTGNKCAKPHRKHIGVRQLAI